MNKSQKILNINIKDDTIRRNKMDQLKKLPLTSDYVFKKI